MSPLCTSTFNDIATIRRSHTLAEPVGSLTLNLARLIRSFHYASLQTEIISKYH